MQHGKAVVFKPTKVTAFRTYLSIAFLLLPALSIVNQSALHDHHDHDQNSQPVKIK